VGERQYTLVLGDSCPRSTIIGGFRKFDGSAEEGKAPKALNSE